MEATMQQILDAIKGIPPPPEQEDIWMSTRTLELIPEGSKEQDYLSRFTALQVRIDDTLPYMHFETTSQRKKRLEKHGEVKPVYKCDCGREETNYWAFWVHAESCHKFKG